MSKSDSQICIRLNSSKLNQQSLKSDPPACKVANLDPVDHQACSMLQYINVIANLFISINVYYV